MKTLSGETLVEKFVESLLLISSFCNQENTMHCYKKIFYTIFSIKSNVNTTIINVLGNASAKYEIYKGS